MKNKDKQKILKSLIKEANDSTHKFCNQCGKRMEVSLKKAYWDDDGDNFGLYDTETGKPTDYVTVLLGCAKRLYYDGGVDNVPECREHTELSFGVARNDGSL